jgi:hypothetical protein
MTRSVIGEPDKKAAIQTDHKQMSCKEFQKKNTQMSCKAEKESPSAIYNFYFSISSIQLDFSPS